jgi:hypothetical protein
MVANDERIVPRTAAVMYAAPPPAVYVPPPLYVPSPVYSVPPGPRRTGGRMRRVPMELPVCGNAGPFAIDRRRNKLSDLGKYYENLAPAGAPHAHWWLDGPS